MLLLTPLGLLCRFVPLGLPQVIVKYGGSFLWAAMVYWLIALLFVRLSPAALGVISLLASTAVEFFKNIHTAALESFRDTFAGKVLLGRYFSFTDIAIYWFAIACAVWIDRTALRRAVEARE
ncbi:MAG TPA: DUF2809 domain-containing protein [Candidatus Aquilonibacter sp.]|nr:DUF2809 domain-containing protein [Candidatus Aquilonibacter sp.]